MWDHTRGSPASGASADGNQNQIPDECELILSVGPIQQGKTAVLQAGNLAAGAMGMPATSTESVESRLQKFGGVVRPAIGARRKQQIVADDGRTHHTTDATAAN